MIRFSIITCTLNSEKYILRNIESVKNQTFNNFEHIFIDGFSKDNTVKIIKNYINNKDDYSNKIKLFQYEPKGIANAFNLGIKHSNGEYLFFLNSDDYFYDNNVLIDVHKFLNENNLDWIYGMINVVDDKNIFRGLWPRRKILHFNYKIFFGRYLMKFYNYIPHQGVFIKKEVFDNFGCFLEDLVYFPDLEYWLRIRNKTKWSFFNRIIANYLVHFSAESYNLKNQEIIKKSAKIREEKYLNFVERLLAHILGKIIIFLRSKNIFVKNNNEI
ncbi:MAG: glycosyltransferase family 2 protein [Candidatus Aenigmatarchaeota archaeon]